MGCELAGLKTPRRRDGLPPSQGFNIAGNPHKIRPDHLFGGSSMSTKFVVLAATAALAIAAPAQAQEKLKIGLITTLSGPPASLGTQQRNGVQLALKTLGNKLGGREVELLV